MNTDLTKNSILTVANQQFSRYGFHKTSMNAIAKIAHKAKGSLYYHFASKEDLFKEVISKEIDNFKKKLEVIVNNSDFSASEKLEQYFKKRMENLYLATTYQVMLEADFFERFHFVDDLRNDLEIWEKENLRKVILQGINSGEFVIDNDVNSLLDMIVMLLKGLEIPFFVQGKYKKFLLPFNRTINILTKGLSK